MAWQAPIAIEDVKSCGRLVHSNLIQARSVTQEVKLGPLLGEHTFTVLSEILGLTPDEIADHAAAGSLD